MGKRDDIKPLPTLKSGFKGVHFKRGRWRAVLGGAVDGKTQKHLGCFATAEEAANAWRIAAEKTARRIL
jgi:hypothetical protein